MADTPADIPTDIPDPGSWSEPAHVDVAPEQALSVHVDGFDGPLDLLLALARTHKLDISKVSVLALADTNSKDFHFFMPLSFIPHSSLKPQNH